jgi:hypothetical protein
MQLAIGMESQQSWILTQILKVTNLRQLLGPLISHQKSSLDQTGDLEFSLSILKEEIKTRVLANELKHQVLSKIHSSLMGQDGSQRKIYTQIKLELYIACNLTKKNLFTIKQSNQMMADSGERYRYMTQLTIHNPR